MQLTFSAHFGSFSSQTWSELISDASGKAFFVVTVSGENRDEFRQRIESIFTQASVLSALSLHQLCEQALSIAEGMRVVMRVTAGFFETSEHRCSLCTNGGTVLLKRAEKTGQILTATNELKIIEGKLQLDDVFSFVVPLSENETTELANISLKVATGDEAEPPIHSGKVLAKSDGSLSSDSVLTAESDEGKAVDSLKKRLTVSMVLGQLKILVKAGVRVAALCKQYVQMSMSSDVYVRQEAKKKVLRIFVPVLAVVLVGAAIVFYQSSQQKKQLALADTLIQPIEVQLIDVKQLAQTQPLAARQKTEELIAQLESLKKQNSSQKTVVSLLQKEEENLKKYYNSISGLAEFPALLPFYDLRLVKSDFIANRMDLQENSLVFLDSGQGKVIALDTEKKQWTDIPVGSAAQLKDIQLYGKFAYVLGDGLYRVNLADSKDTVQLKENTELIQNSSLMKTFQQYLYVLNVAQNNIFRYSPNADDKNKLSEAVGWLRQPITLDLGSVQSLAVDGDLWVGTKTGEIKKFTSGTQADFTVTGVKSPLSKPLFIYTKEDLANLYVLEPENQRLLVISKTGEFLREVKSPTFASTTSVVANEKTKKAYVLSGALIFQVDL